MNFSRIVIFFIIIYFTCAYSFLDLSYFNTLVSNLVDDKNSDCPDEKTPREMCDENQIMLHLAKMCIICPERVLMLLTTGSFQASCTGAFETLEEVNKAQTGCIPLSTDNLYMKLLNTLKFFHSQVCLNDSRLKKKINKFEDCLLELKEEFHDCEGQPDWYENTNQTIRCQVLNNIVDCNYIKTAMLCGLDLAATIRSFAAELFQQALPPKTMCIVSRSLPFVEEPMPASTNQIFPCSVFSLTSFIVLIKTILK